MKHALTILAVISLSACTTYWNNPNKDLQQTAKDLSECRLQAAESTKSGTPIYTAAELEAPCMSAKGYTLGYTPPK